MTLNMFLLLPCYFVILAAATKCATMKCPDTIMGPITQAMEELAPSVWGKAPLKWGFHFNQKAEEVDFWAKLKFQITVSSWKPLEKLLYSALLKTKEMTVKEHKLFPGLSSRKVKPFLNICALKPGDTKIIFKQGEQETNVYEIPVPDVFKGKEASLISGINIIRVTRPSRHDECARFNY